MSEISWEPHVCAGAAGLDLHNGGAAGPVLRSDVSHECEPPVLCVATDDKRFLMIRRHADKGELIVVEDFFEELKATVRN